MEVKTKFGTYTMETETSTELTSKTKKWWWF
jgi:hypothetical protein